MGEVAEMMLDGTLCAGCGEFMGMDSGFASYCSPECAGDHGAEYWGEGQKVHDPKPHQCPQCSKRFRTEGGMKMHLQSVHQDRRKVRCPGCGKRVKACGLKMHMEAKGCTGTIPRPQPVDFDVLDDGDDFSPWKGGDA